MSKDNDIQFEYEEDENRDGFGRTKKEKELREQLRKCEEESKENLAGWQRAKADLINQRREFEERSRQLGSFATESLITELLSVLDSFEMAFRNKEVWEQVDENWRRGVEYIHTQFDKILGEHGLNRIETENNGFDPLIHESVGTVHTNNKESDGKVAEVVQSGYRMRDKVIRPAKVKVYEYSQ